MGICPRCFLCCRACISPPPLSSKQIPPLLRLTSHCFYIRDCSTDFPYLWWRQKVKRYFSIAPDEPQSTYKLSLFYSIICYRDAQARWPQRRPAPPAPVLLQSCPGIFCGGALEPRIFTPRTPGSSCPHLQKLRALIAVFPGYYWAPQLPEGPYGTVVSCYWVMLDVADC